MTLKKVKMENKMYVNAKGELMIGKNQVIGYRRKKIREDQKTMYLNFLNMVVQIKIKTK